MLTAYIIMRSKCHPLNDFPYDWCAGLSSTCCMLLHISLNSSFHRDIFNMCTSVLGVGAEIEFLVAAITFITPWVRVVVTFVYSDAVCSDQVCFVWSFHASPQSSKLYLVSQVYNQHLPTTFWITSITFAPETLPLWAAVWESMWDTNRGPLS